MSDVKKRPLQNSATEFEVNYVANLISRLNMYFTNACLWLFYFNFFSVSDFCTIGPLEQMNENKTKKERERKLNFFTKKKSTIRDW